MKKIAVAAIVAGIILFAGAASANYYYRDGTGALQQIFSFVCQGTIICPGQVIIDSTGAEKATPSNPLRVDPVGTTAQPVTGTFWPYTLGPSMATNAVPVVQAGYTYKNITTDTTTVVKSSAGVLHTITINTPVSTGTVTIYDNTAASGTKIGTFTVPNAATPITLTYDVAFLTGLTVVSAVEVMDFTVSYQ